MSPAALELLHVLEPVVGRIIGVSILKYACSKAQLDFAALVHDQISELIPHIESSLIVYDRSAELAVVLKQLAAAKGGGEP